MSPAVAEQLEIDARYAGYLERQARDIAAFRRDEALLLPETLDYAAIGGSVGGSSRQARGGTAGNAWRGVAYFRGDPGGPGRAAAICKAAAGSGVTVRRPPLDAAEFRCADRGFT